MISPHEQEASFRRWLDAHVGLMLKIVRGCAATPADQDDLFQDVRLQLWSSITAFRGDAKETAGYTGWPSRRAARCNTHHANTRVVVASFQDAGLTVPVTRAVGLG